MYWVINRINKFKITEIIYYIKVKRRLENDIMDIVKSDFGGLIMQK